MRTWLLPAAAAHQVDPVTLLALARAESDEGAGIDPRAERWGARTAAARAAIAAGDIPALASVIAEAGADISFSAFQVTLAFGYWPDPSATPANLLRFRAQAFANPAQVADCVAAWLARTLPTVAGDALRAFVVYNSGGDNLGEAWYQERWGANIRRYAAALTWAEGFRVGH